MCRDPEIIVSFLNFCEKFYLDCPIDGNIIKGAAGMEERALRLLEKYGDVNKAMYAVIKPISLLLNPELIDHLPEEQILRELEEASVELKKIKKDSKEDILEKIKKAVRDGISQAELQNLMQVATNMRVSLPQEIVNYLTEAEKFSHELKKLLKTKKLEFNELQALAAQAREYKVVTEEIENLTALLLQATRCEQTARTLAAPSYKQLQQLYNESAALPVLLPSFALLQERYLRARKWVESANSFMRGWKSNGKCSAGEVQDLLNEATTIDFTHSEVHKLEKVLDTVHEGKECCLMLKHDKDSEKALAMQEELNEDPVESPSECGGQWANRARKVLELKKIQQKLLTQLDNEARAKGLAGPLVKEVQRLLKDSRDWREEVKRVISRVDPPKACELLKLLDRAKSIPTDIEPHVAQLTARLKKLEIKEKTENSENQKENEWLEHVQDVLELLPRDAPEVDELNCARKLLSSVPAALKSGEECRRLAELVRDSEDWNRQCLQSLKCSSEETLQETYERARTLYVNLKNYHELRKKLRSFRWEAEAKDALANKSPIHVLKALKIEGISLKFEKNPLHHELAEVLHQFSHWNDALKSTCKEGSIEELEKLYRTAPDNLPAHRKQLLKMSLLSMYICCERAQTLSTAGGTYQELKTLLSEANIMCFDNEEISALHEYKEKLKVWLDKTRPILGPHRTHSLPSPRLFKKRCLLEEYYLNPQEDLMENLIASCEDAQSFEIPSVSYSFPFYHPSEGISVVVHRKKLFSLKNYTPREPKKHRNFLPKQKLSDDMGTAKKPPKYPRRFEDSEEYCICMREASWNDTMMIACDCCEEWYHPSCLSMNPAELEKLEQFICPVCYERAGIRIQKESKYAVTVELIDALISEGQQFNITTEELGALIGLRQAIQRWRETATDALQQGLQSDGLQESVLTGRGEAEQIIFDTKLMRLLNRSESLPVMLPQREKILGLLRKRDWVREAFKTVHLRVSSRNIKKLLREHKIFDEEITEVTDQLEKTLERINDITTEIALLQSEHACLDQYKRLLDAIEPQFLKMEKLEKLKKKIDTLDAVIAELNQGTDLKDYTLLKELYEKADKVGVVVPQIQELKERIICIEKWIEKVVEVVSHGMRRDTVEDLLDEARELKFNYFYIKTLQDYLKTDYK